MAHEGSVARKHDTRIDAAFAHWKLPHRLASLRLECVHGAVATAGNEESSSGDVGDDRCRVGCVKGPAARRTYPDGLTVVLVEGHKTVATDRLASPARGQPTDDH